MGFGSFVSSLAGSAASSASAAGLSGLGGLVSQKQQYGYTKKQRLKGPGWDVQGLRDAGLNPILAAGSPGAPTPVSGFSVSAPDPSSSAKNISSSQLQKAQKNVVENQVTSASETARMDSMKADIENMVYNAYNSPMGRNFLMPLSAMSRAGLTINSPAMAASALALFHTMKHKYPTTPTTEQGKLGGKNNPYHLKPAIRKSK